MDPICSQIRDRLASLAGAVDASEGEIRAHLERCEACASWLRLHQRQVDSLRGLAPRRAPAELDRLVAQAMQPDVREQRAIEALAHLHPLAAPANLDGSVVAALHAGSRQERSLRHLSALDRLETPADLDERAAALSASRPRVMAGRPSPPVLERLLREDLEDLPRALCRRFTAKLPRLSAPAELDQRVRLELARGGRPERSRWFGVPPLVALVAASLLLGVIGWSQFGREDSAADRNGQLAALDIEVRHLTAEGAFSDPTVDPLTRRLADELSNSRLSVAESVQSTENALGNADPGGSGDTADAPEPGADPVDPNAPQPAPSGGSGGNSGAGQPGTNPAPGTVPLQRALEISRDLLARMELAHLVPVHLQRLVELHDPSNPALDLVYQEEVLRDGFGAFAVLPGQVFHPALTPTESLTFGLLQGARQGYVERHRDFRIRDLLLFRNNYTIVDLRRSTQVAGVTCVWLEVQSRYNTSITWRLAVDPNTGLVLNEERVDQNGSLLARIETVTVDYQPDFSNAVLDGGPSAWQPVSGLALGALKVHVPTLLPEGYQLFETATLRDALGRDWVRQLFSDGLGELFFLHEQSTSVLQGVGQAGNQANVLNAFQISGAHVLDGEVRGVRVIVVGLLPEQELLRSIDSALP